QSANEQERRREKPQPEPGGASRGGHGETGFGWDWIPGIGRHGATMAGMACEASAIPRTMDGCRGRVRRLFTAPAMTAAPVSRGLQTLLQHDPVVVTGMGAVCAAGTTTAALWDAAVSGKSNARWV